MPNVPENAVIILDNAPNQNRVSEPVPTISPTKSVMRTWLTKNEIEWNATDLKKDLFEKIKERQPEKCYVTDKLAGEKGIAVIRTPVAYCELNSMKLVWSKVKEYLRLHNTTFKLADLEKLVLPAFQSVSKDMWKNFCRHAKKQEDEFWKKDGFIEEAVDQFIVNLEVPYYLTFCCLR